LRILGLDILPDRQKFFAVVIDSETGEIILRNVIRREDIEFLIRKFDIDTIAIDNIFELYETSEEIINFLERTSITLVQVTGAPFKQTKLSVLARKYGLHRGEKLPPETAAEVAAKLAMMSEGAQIIALRDATLVIVSRSRHFGQVGGSHQRQYLRSAEARIKTVVKDIINSLARLNIAYDAFVREGEGGYKSAKIIVYESYDKIRRIVREVETDWINVRIEPIRHSRLVFIFPRDSSLSRGYKHYIIVGVDPGETTGLALLDLKGNVLYVGSRRGIGFFDLIDKIYEYGKPLIISTDVPKVPHFVSLLSQKSGAIIFNPRRTLSTFRKNELVKKLGVKVGDSHQRDALIAAFLAFKHFEKKFSKIDNIVKYIPIIDPERVKADVVFRNLDIRTAIMSQLSGLLMDSKAEKSDTVSQKELQLLRENEILRKKYLELRDQIDELREKIQGLRESLRGKDNEIRQLRNKLRDLERLRSNDAINILKDRDKVVMELMDNNKILSEMVSKLEKRVSELETRNEILLRIAQRKPSEIIIKKIEKLSLNSLLYWKREYGLSKYDFILTRTISWSSELVDTIIRHVAGLILYGSEDIPPDIAKNLLRSGIIVLRHEDVSDIVDLNMIVQRIDVGLLDERIRTLILDYLDEEEKAYIEFKQVLEEYRKKRAEELENME